MKLKTYIYSFLAVLLMVGTLSSCMSSDDEVSTDEYCYISGFTIGNLKRTVYVNTDNGSDSTYTVSFSGALYPMSIDQRTLTIENKDSLPFGTHVNAVLATINYKGVIAYKKVGDVDYTTFSSKDSLDFSAPLDFVVLSNSGNSERHYTVKLNVHKQDGRRFDWKSLPETDVLSLFAERRLVVKDGRMLLMGKSAMGAVLCASRSADLEDQWKLTEVTGAGTADVTTLQLADNGTMLMSTTNGAILQSDNGYDWKAKTDVCEGRRLVGVSSCCLYAMANGQLMSSSDEGKTWISEALDDDAVHLPNSEITMLQRRQTNGYTRLMMIGCREGNADGKAEVWSKAWSDTDSEMNVQWMYFLHTADNIYLCPQLSPLFVLPYDKGFVAFGGGSKDGKQKALETMLYSPDYGLTWNREADLRLPSELAGRTDAMAATVDADSFIWIVTGKQTWRGRLGRLGF